MEFANLSTLPTVFGLCTMFKKVNRPYHPKKNYIHFKNRDYTRNYKCNINQPFVRINTPKTPCRASDLVSECEQKCYEKKLNQQSFKCKSPFMENSELPLCKTQETAKETYKTYLKAQFKTDPHKECSCVASCEETIFLPSIIQQFNGDQSEIKYTIDNNIREVITDKEMISIAKLLCQIGSVIGILTGFSIFALVEYLV
uniref:Uncharacterized protein n=1 Tax=Strigamia maritima TaxID=126957 RepID=T1J8N6_STRMM